MKLLKIITISFSFLLHYVRTSYYLHTFCFPVPNLQLKSALEYVRTYYVGR